MHITPTYNQNFKALVPIKDYKGVVLKLTKEDSKKIADLINEKTLLLFELDNISKKLSKIKTLTGSSKLLDYHNDVLYKIKKIDDAIREIKVSRKNEQLKKL